MLQKYGLGHVVLQLPDVLIFFALLRNCDEGE